MRSRPRHWGVGLRPQTYNFFRQQTRVGRDIIASGNRREGGRERVGTFGFADAARGKRCSGAQSSIAAERNGRRPTEGAARRRKAVATIPYGDFGRQKRGASKCLKGSHEKIRGGGKGEATNRCIICDDYRRLPISDRDFPSAVLGASQPLCSPPHTHCGKGASAPQESNAPGEAREVREGSEFLTEKGEWDMDNFRTFAPFKHVIS